MEFQAKALGLMMLCIDWTVLLSFLTASFAMVYAQECVALLSPEEPWFRFPYFPFKFSSNVTEVIYGVIFGYILVRLRFFLDRFGNFIGRQANVERLSTSI